MFIAIDRNSGLFNKETSDQINVRINALTNVTKSLGSKKTREHYYDNVGDLPIDFNVNVIRNSSFQYGKVLVIDFSFSRSVAVTICQIANYEMPYKIYVNVCDKEGNLASAVITETGEMKWVVNPTVTGECAVYCVIIKAAD